MVSFYKYCSTPLDISAVVVDGYINLSFKQIARAHMLLANPEIKFIVGATDYLLPFSQPTLGPGGIFKMLEETTQRKGLVLGKPGLGLRDMILAKYNITDPKRVLFVGDM